LDSPKERRKPGALRKLRGPASVRTVRAVAMFDLDVKTIRVNLNLRLDCVISTCSPNQWLTARRHHWRRHYHFIRQRMEAKR
jgi:hypothetical protein